MSKWRSKNTIIRTSFNLNKKEKAAPKFLGEQILGDFANCTLGQNIEVALSLTPNNLKGEDRMRRCIKCFYCEMNNEDAAVAVHDDVFKTTAPTVL